MTISSKHLSEWKWVKVTQLCLTLCDPINCLWNSLGQNTTVVGLSLLQGIFLTQGLNPGLPHCRHILYQLSHKGSPRILEWAAYPFSSRSSQPRNWTGVSCISGIFFTSWATREALASNYSKDYKVSHWSFLGLGQDLRKIHFYVSPILTYTFFSKF